MNSSEYIQTVEHIKNEITSAQYRAMQKVNSELVILYYNIGKVINEHKSWGNKFIDNLAKDITIKKMAGQEMFLLIKLKVNFTKDKCLQIKFLILKIHLPLHKASWLCKL
jgi:hypothetical protein